MSTVEEFCHRALLIDSGRVLHVGDPAEVGRRYLQLNFERGSDAGDRSTARTGERVRLLDAWVEGADGSRLAGLGQGEQIRLRVSLEAICALPGIGLGFVLANADGVGVFEFGAGVSKDGATRLAARDRVEVSVDVENLLAPGRYFIHTGVNLIGGGVALYVHNSVDFVVYGGEAQARGIVALPYSAGAAIEAAGER
jgi:hypothetical protein